MSETMSDRSTWGERAAGVVAILLLGAAVAVVAAGSVVGGDGLLLALAGLLAVVVAGWHIVSRRGMARSVGIAIAVVGMGLSVSGFVVAQLHGLLIATVAVLGLLSVGTPRYALHRGTRAWQELALQQLSVE